MRMYDFREKVFRSKIDSSVKTSQTSAKYNHCTYDYLVATFIYLLICLYEKNSTGL